MKNILEILTEPEMFGWPTDRKDPACSSRSEARRLIKGKGVYFTREMVNPPKWNTWEALDENFDMNSSFTIRIGSKYKNLRFCKIEVR